MEHELNGNRIFHFLNDDEKHTLLNNSQEIRFAAGEVICQEGEKPSNFFIILKGSVNVSKKDKKNREHILDELHAGELIGETALVDDHDRPVSYLAKEPVILLVFKIEDIEKNTDLHNKLILALSKRFAQRLRKFKYSTFESMQHRLDEYYKRASLGIFLVGAIYITDIYILSLFFINELKKKLDTTTYISITILAVIVGVIIYNIKKYNYPLTMFGLTTKNWKKDLIESIYFSVIFIVIFTLAKWILIHTFYRYHNLSLFDIRSAFEDEALFNWPDYFIGLIAYILFVPFQEFIVRGTLQGTFYQFLAGTEKQRTWTAILVSNFLFAVVHLHADPPILPFLAFTIGIFWGYLYSRQSSLIGVTVSHIIVGVWVIFICGVIALF